MHLMPILLYFTAVLCTLHAIRVRARQPSFAFGLFGAAFLALALGLRLDGWPLLILGFLVLAGLTALMMALPGRPKRPDATVFAAQETYRRLGKQASRSRAA